MLLTVLAAVTLAPPQIYPTPPEKDRALVAAALAPYRGSATPTTFVTAEGKVYSNRLDVQVWVGERVPGTRRWRWPNGEEFVPSSPIDP